LRISAEPFCDPRQLTAIDDLIRQAPAQIGLRFGRACCLEDLGHIEESIQAYVDVLRREPTHLGALTNLGSLLLERGFTTDARPYLTAAATHHPADPVALVNLARLQADAGETAAAISGYRSALALKPDLLQAHLGLAKLYAQSDDDAELAQTHLDHACAEPKIWHYPYRGTAPPLKVLLLASAFGGEVVSNRFFDHEVVQRSVLLADSVRDDVVLPPHDVLFNAIGDADRSRPSLERARAIAARSRAAVINDPAAVLRTGRVEMMQRLRGRSGIRAPLTERFTRAALTPAALKERGFTFPLLLRSPGHHAGMHFTLVSSESALAEVAASLPGRDLLAIEYIDARGTDGDVRKYRVVFVDGRLYPAHLAIAPQWKVHYFSAAMAERPDHRAEEKAFLNDMPAVVGEPVMRALEAICSTLQLDYAGVDFGIDRDGTTVVFEANATMAVYPPAAGEMWAYRSDAVDEVTRAVRAMLQKLTGHVEQR
jgi:Flp pilus assembly protein TadD/glutathione synthase/RimK-type ligase-like ATP-grasp enzyme